MPEAGEQHWSDASSGRAAQAECQQRARSTVRMPAAEGQRSANASSGRALQFECQPPQHSAVRMPPAGGQMPAAGRRGRSNASSGGQRRPNASRGSAVRNECQQRRRVAKRWRRAVASNSYANPCTQKGSAPKTPSQVGPQDKQRQATGCGSATSSASRFMPD
jgi:hypothetical protein